MVRLAEKIFASMPKLRTTPTNDTVLAVLGFRYLSLLANIVLIAAQAAPWDFADPLPNARSGDRPGWIALGFSAMKLNPIGSLTAITAIAMPERFVSLDSLAAATLIWQLAIVIGLAALGMLLAATNRRDCGLSKE
jgi:uncharacterized protein (TIGR00645 family)